MNSFQNTVIHADCLKAMPMLPDRSIDFILTDPPYIARYRPRDGRKVLNDDNDRWLKPAFAQMYRVLAADSYCVSFYGWPMADRFMEAFRKAGFRPVGHFTFVKRYASSVGHVRCQHENAYLLAKGNPARPKAPPGDVIEWRYPGNKHHPTEKPVSALLPLVESFSRPDAMVLDPFAGAGSSLLVARTLGRNCIGVEMDYIHHATASRRLKEHLMEQAA